MGRSNNQVKAYANYCKRKWEVEKIVAKRHGERGIEYKVKWVGCEDEDTWEPIKGLANCKDKIAEYEGVVPYEEPKRGNRRK